MHPTLTAHARSRLFAQLATLEHAGISPAQAFTMMGGDLPPGVRRALARTASALARGMSIAEAGEKNGVWVPWEARAINAAAASGRLESLFADLSAHYAGRAKRFARMKSRLTFPLLILLLACLVAPFPALFQGAIGPGGYLLRALGPPVLLYGGLRLLVFAYRRQLARETGVMWSRLLLAIPVLGGVLARQQRRDGLLVLLLLLESGVPILEALPLAGHGVADPLLRAQDLDEHITHQIDASDQDDHLPEVAWIEYIQWSIGLVRQDGEDDEGDDQGHETLDKAVEDIVAALEKEHL